MTPPPARPADNPLLAIALRVGAVACFAVMGASAAVNVLHRKRLAATPPDEREALLATLRGYFAEQRDIHVFPGQASQVDVVMAFGDRTLRGTVTRMEWINPHSWIHLDVKNPDGTVSKWMIEGGTPNTLFRRGLTKDSLKSGTEITVEGYRAKNGALRANGADLILPDGRRLFLGSSGTGAPKDVGDGQ